MAQNPLETIKWRCDRLSIDRFAEQPPWAPVVHVDFHHDRSDDSHRNHPFKLTTRNPKNVRRSIRTSRNDRIKPNCAKWWPRQTRDRGPGSGVRVGWAMTLCRAAIFSCERYVNVECDREDLREEH